MGDEHRFCKRAAIPRSLLMWAKIMKNVAPLLEEVDKLKGMVTVYDDAGERALELVESRRQPLRRQRARLLEELLDAVRQL